MSNTRPVSNEEIGRKLDSVLHECGVLKHALGNINLLLNGREDPSRGLIVRVDRLERESNRARAAEASLKKFAWSTVTGLALAAVAWAWNRITGKGTP